MSKLAELLQSRKAVAANPANSANSADAPGIESAEISRISKISRGGTPETIFQPAALPLSPVSEAARRRVLDLLARDPRITRAAVTRWEGGVCVVTLGIRDIGTCDLHIPRERLAALSDYQRLLECLESPLRADA